MKAEVSRVSLDDHKENWECSTREGPRSVTFTWPMCVCVSRPLFEALQNEESTSPVPKVSHLLH